jgi:hypothetical protein
LIPTRAIKNKYKGSHLVGSDDLVGSSESSSAGSPLGKYILLILNVYLFVCLMSSDLDDSIRYYKTNCNSRSPDEPLNGEIGIPF